MQVEVTRLAARYIRKRGGELYVWADDVSEWSPFGFLQYASSAPFDGVYFEHFDVDDIQVHIQRGIGDNGKVVIARALSGVELTWTGTSAGLAG